MIGAIVFWIVVGAIAGALAKLIMPGDDPGGVIVTLILGIVGALVGGFLASLIGIGGGGWLWSIITATIGATILLAIYRLIVGRRGIPRFDEAGDTYTSSGRVQSDTSGAPRRTDLGADNQESDLLQMVSRKRSSRKGARKYDVFVSYRRQHGAEVARLISNGLKNKGKRAFIDVDDLPAGLYDEALLATVASTPNFVVVLTPHALDHTIEGQEDWLRQEIAEAIRTNSNIVPVLMADFQFPSQQALPSDIRNLPKYQGVRYSHDYFDGMLERLVNYLRS